MSDASIEQSMASIRLHLASRPLLQYDDIVAIAGDDAEKALEQMFEDGQVAKTLAGGLLFYSLSPRLSE